MSIQANITRSAGINAAVGEAKLIQGEKGDRGVMWYTGTALTGTATVEGTAPAAHLDLYLNTDTSNVYQCTVPSETAATWVYLCNIKGLTGDTGATGATGNGIASAVLNADYTLTLTYTNGQTYTTPSIRGAKGDTGAAGQKGQDGQDGESPYIGLNGNWYVGETDTGTPAQGKEGNCGYELTATLIAENWLGGSAPFYQTIAIDGLALNGYAYVVAAGAQSWLDYGSAQVRMEAPVTANTAKFYCTTKPSANIAVNILKVAVG